jgi:hypothetical protein
MTGIMTIELERNEIEEELLPCNVRIKLSV